jgi:hypothetical protein
MEKMNRSSQVKKDLVIEFLNMMLEDADIVDVDFIPTGHQKLTKRGLLQRPFFRMGHLAQRMGVVCTPIKGIDTKNGKIM